MKHFRLAGAGYRNAVDLRVYESAIRKAVNIVNPQVIVDVHRSYFTTTPDLSKRESIKVSTILRSQEMAELTTYRPCLFNSTATLTREEQEEAEHAEQSEQRPNDRNHRQKVGGRKRDSREIPTNQQKGN